VVFGSQISTRQRGVNSAPDRPLLQPKPLIQWADSCSDTLALSLISNKNTIKIIVAPGIQLVVSYR
jgi:hypothetical protein